MRGSFAVIAFALDEPPCIFLSFEVCCCGFFEHFLGEVAEGNCLRFQILSVAFGELLKE